MRDTLDQRDVMNDRLIWLATASAAILSFCVPIAGDLVIIGAGSCALLASVSRTYRGRLSLFSAGLLWGSLAGLALLLLTDHFNVRYVWLYSGADLPLYLKLANLWGGDEGTTLLLAAFCMGLAIKTRDVPSRFDVTALIGAAIALTAAYLGPFTATPKEWLAQTSSQGMNAHLMNMWMLAHAPLVLAAYAWTLSLASPAIAALGGEITKWPKASLAHARRAWALLTAGIGFGMVWAFEDAMYGHVWHWDPVQTSVFSVWCLLGAHLHGISGWRLGTKLWRWVPLSGLIAAALTMFAMGVTRHETLASSHRYVGATSSLVYFSLAGILIAAGVFAWVHGSKKFIYKSMSVSPVAWGMRFTYLLFVALGLSAIAHLGWAFIASAQDLPRPDELTPFYATLVNWANGSEIPALRETFAQWDVDGYALVRVLLYFLIGVGLVGGWCFLRRSFNRLAWVSLSFAILICVGVWYEGGFLMREYKGSGILSQQIVAVLSRIDASLVAGAYLALGAAVWTVQAARKASAKSYVLALGLLHIGAIVSLWGALLSTTLNAYSQHVIEMSDAWQRSHYGYAFRINSLNFKHYNDGGRTEGADSFRAIAQVELKAPSQELSIGQALYRDTRSAITSYDGPVRQICEILDYRYARYASHPGYVLHPFIDRGLTKDVQVWVSTAAVVAAMEGGPQPSQAVVVLRIYPFISLLWIGLVLSSVSALWLSFRPKKIYGKDKV